MRMSARALILFITALFSVPTTAQALRAAPAVRTLSDVVYATVGTRSLHMDLALPREASTKPRPVIVWIHGGGWKMGSHKPNRAAQFTALGFVTASVEYRLTGEATFPAQIHDCKAAIRFLRAHSADYGIDPKRIGVWGGSAGGHLTALLGTTAGVSELEGSYGSIGESSRIQAMCLFYPPTDLTLIARSEPLRKKPTPVAQLLGGKPSERASLAKLASPVYHATSDDAPTLIFHGDIDELVPIAQSQRLCEALKAVGVEAKLVTVKGGKHGLTTPGQAMPLSQIEAAVGRFFVEKLKP